MRSWTHHDRPSCAARDRYGPVAAAPGTAFHDDPVLSFLLPHGIRNRQRRLRSFFALEAPRSLRHGGVWTSEGRGPPLFPMWRDPA